MTSFPYAVARARAYRVIRAMLSSGVIAVTGGVRPEIIDPSGFAPMPFHPDEVRAKIK